MQVRKHRSLALFAVLAIAACSGDKGQQGDPGSNGATGPQGPAGADGAAGAQGPAGVSTGGVIGTLTYKTPDGVEHPATNVNVTSDPNWCEPAVSGADGTYHLGSGCPIGVYTVTFSGNGFATVKIPNISVVAGKEFVLDQVLVPNNPLTLTSAAATAPAGFNKTVAVSAKVSGGTAPYTFTWTPVAAAAGTSKSNPTSVTVAAATADDGVTTTGTFTTGTVANVIAGCKVIGFGPTGTDYNTAAPGPGLAPAANNCPVPATAVRASEFLGVGSIQVGQLTYNFDVTATDAQGFTKTLRVAVPTANLSKAYGQKANLPKGTLVIGYFPGNTADLTSSFVKPSASAAVLNDAATAYPWFIADSAGEYKFGPTDKVLDAWAADYSTANPQCGGCHSAWVADGGANVQEKFKEWTNSAHGNHFFKYFKYDSNGQLVPLAAGEKLPTADAKVFWNATDITAPMTLFQFGTEGGEGTHYSGSCIGCHTTGYNALAANNGADDVMKALGYSYPNLATVLTLTGTNTTTTGPQTAAWDAMPTQVKAYAGMQCESCHNPLGMHVTTGYMKPVAEFGVEACAVCHDAPSHHDKVWLWRQSGHANATVAVDEFGSASCFRCHQGQGYAMWIDQQQAGGDLAPGALLDDAGNVIDPKTLFTKDQMQPQTCQTCHDPHTTELRVQGDTGMLPSGFAVNGAGTGAICMTCHNSRNGPHGEGVTAYNWASSAGKPGAYTASTSIGAPHQAKQTDVYAGQNAYFVTVAKPSGHLAVADTCAGCHLKAAVDGLAMAGTNHTFAVNESICKNCHGEEVNGEALKAAFEAKFEELGGVIVNATYAALPDSFAVGTTTYAKTDVKLAGITESHGQPAFFMDVTGSTTQLTVNLSAFKVSTATDAATVFNLLNGIIAKSMWNYFLVEDGSYSFHNPGFVFDVMQATSDAIEAGGAAW